MCKDVECTFVILKGRWRILKSGVQIYGVDSADYVWFTCCALHNWLLDIDGLSEKWIDTDNWLRNEKMDHRSYPVWCQTSKTVEWPFFGLLLPPHYIVTLDYMLNKWRQCGWCFKFVDWGQGFLGSGCHSLQKHLLGTVPISTVSAIDGRGRQWSQAMVYTWWNNGCTRCIHTSQQPNPLMLPLVG